MVEDIVRFLPKCSTNFETRIDRAVLSANLTSQNCLFAVH